MIASAAHTADAIDQSTVIQLMDGGLPPKQGRPGSCCRLENSFGQHVKALMITGTGIIRPASPGYLVGLDPPSRSSG